jgi:hypothetical protein
MLPKVTALVAVTANFANAAESAATPDSSVRTQSEIVGASGDFARESITRLETLLTSASQSLDNAVNG